MWAAPEVVCGQPEQQSDVWSIGSIAFRLAENLVRYQVKDELNEM